MLVKVANHLFDCSLNLANICKNLHMKLGSLI